MPSITITLKALRELGLIPSVDLLRYKFGKTTGWYRRTVLPLTGQPGFTTAPLLFLSPVKPNSEKSIAKVGALLSGEVELFGAVKAPLDFSIPGRLQHWTFHEQAQIEGKDIKYFWEPARFCWVAGLAAAYSDGHDRKFFEFFSEKLSEFMLLNPPYQGPHWTSGQEAGIRLMNIALAASIFKEAVPGLSGILAVHAARIPPTMVYARAQRNNHLLSEAAALFTAGLVLPNHPEAEHWRTLGWRTFCDAVLDQFTSEGVYMQQSANYHRLVLQLALWVHSAAGTAGLSLPDGCLNRLAAATRHLLELCDPGNGAVPNLGPNDGAYIFPLTELPFADYRPVLQAAARAFLGGPAFEPGPWDDMSAWFGMPAVQGEKALALTSAKMFLHHPRCTTRASLRAAEFIHRPGHADQLHVDLWWRGMNLAADPGTYQYNADPPWNNPLVSAYFHNTITIDGHDQMTPAGRFLYVDRAQAKRRQYTNAIQAAEHDGYRALGLTHRRSLTPTPTGWRVEDAVFGQTGRSHRVRLHWLLLDHDWILDGRSLVLKTPEGPVKLKIEVPDEIGYTIGLVRAGERLIGLDAHPAAGWYSPTYGVKTPALSFSVEIETYAPVRFVTVWEFPEDA